MKVLIYGVNYAPELTGIGKYSGEMAEWLAEHGGDVRVVTAPPYYPEWRVHDGFSALFFKQEKINGVDIWRCPLYVPEQPSGLKRILHLASFALSSLPIMVRQIFWRPDIIMIIEPPLFCAPVAWLTARLSGAKCWLHIQDFEVDAAFDLGIIPFRWMKRVVSCIESWLMQRFDAVSTISNSMLKRLHEKGVAEPILFPNWADLSHIIFDQVGRSDFRKRIGVREEQCLCLYSGNIAMKQGLDVLLDVASMLPDYRFVICGDGMSRGSLQERAELLQLSNVKFLDLQPLTLLPAMLSAADIHLVIQKGGAADLVMPSKLSNILAVGGVAVVTAEKGTELGRLGDGDHACVRRCSPESAKQLEETIVWLSENREKAIDLSDKAQSYAEKHISKEHVLSQFELDIETLLKIKKD